MPASNAGSLKTPMSKPKNTDEFERLSRYVRALIDGTLSEESQQDLAKLLEQSEDNRKFYLNYIDVETMLTEHWGPTSLETAHFDLPSTDTPLAPQPQNAQSNSTFPPIQQAVGFRFTLTNGLLSACFVLLAMNLFVIWNQQSQTVLPAAGNFSLRRLNYAPKLVATTACIWHSEQTSPSLGTFFESGESIKLVEGIAEFQVQNQQGDKALIRIEGPASIFVKADRQLGIRSGILTADTKSSDSHFQFEIPSGTVVIPGDTSIGISCDTQKCEIHVFKGVAQLRQAWTTSDTSPLAVSQGQSAKLESSDEGKPIVEVSSADDRQFASQQSMYLDRLVISQAYQHAVLDSKPQIYWRFEGERKVKNEAGEEYDAILKGDIGWRKFGSNIAAEFGLSSKWGYFVSEGLWPTEPLKQYTIELWIKPSHYHNGALLGLCVPRLLENGRQNHSLLIEIGDPYHDMQHFTRPNKYRFLHRSPPAIGHQFGSSCYSEQEYEIRKWQHVVARKDGEALSLFVNGELKATNSDPNPLPNNLRIVVGQLYPQKTERPFIGQLDEVAIYDRALTDTEIENHFDAAYQ